MAYQKTLGDAQRQADMLVEYQQLFSQEPEMVDSRPNRDSISYYENKRQNRNALAFVNHVLQKSDRDHMEVLYKLNEIHHNYDKIEVTSEALASQMGKGKHRVGNALRYFRNSGLLARSNRGEMYTDTEFGQKCMSWTRTLLNVDKLRDMGYTIHLNGGNYEDMDRILIIRNSD